MTNQKHLTLSDRMVIETQLSNSTSFKAIASALDKDPSTISKEVRSHLSVERIGGFRKKYNACTKRNVCLVGGLCFPCNAGRNYRFCRSCGMCSRFCPDFEAYSCPKLDKPLYVCNGCKTRPHCTLEKHFYRAKQADKEYRSKLTESRKGFTFSEEELQHFDRIVSPLIRQGQSLHHICVTNTDSLMISERSLYRIIDAGLISAKNLDLPRKVRFKSRKKKKTFKVDRKCREGRTFEDFKKFMEEHPNYPVVQMDSVEGKKGGKVLLTIHFVKAEFMLAFLRDYNDSRSVTDVFKKLYDLLGSERFRHLFPLILTDNGSEFSNPLAIEKDPSGKKRTAVYYCDPQASWQKGSIERNHEFIRYFLPKGTSFDHLCQEDISLMMHHINSYCRESLSNKCPHEMFAFFFGAETLHLLGCRRIPSKEVTLKSSIFRKGGASL